MKRPRSIRRCADWDRSAIERNPGRKDRGFIVWVLGRLIDDRQGALVQGRDRKLIFRGVSERSLDRIRQRQRRTVRRVQRK